MDLMVTLALSEICSVGIDGMSVENLWLRLQPTVSLSGLHLCSSVKKSLWNRLLNIPGLQLTSQNHSFTSQDTKFESFEDAQKLDFKFLASKHLRDCFVGLYDGDNTTSVISKNENRILELLAIARTKGIVQSELSKELGMTGKTLCYAVKKLESRGLIVRQPTIVWTDENATEGESELKNTPPVNTNLIHLYRYAKHLNSQQRFEITKHDTSGNLETASECSTTDDHGKSVKDDVIVRDYVPAMKAVCVELEKADGKVLVVSHIKRALGYKKTVGHRAWRKMLNRLKDAHLVEDFVDNQGVSCLRLLKKIDPKYVQPNIFGVPLDDMDTEQPLKCRKPCQITEQLLDLPIEHQIYDLVDAAGPIGLPFTEVCTQLGLNKKRYYTRLLGFLSRHGMHMQAEAHNKSRQYRVWTSGNFTDGVSYIDLKEDSGLTLQKVESSTSVVAFKSPDRSWCGHEGAEHDCSSPGDKGSSQLLIYGPYPHNLCNDTRLANFNEEHGLERMVNASVYASLEIAVPMSSNSSKLRSCYRYPCLTFTAESAQREQRILERLKEEKFILTAELRRWLASLEKEKKTTMDRGTLIRILSKLQLEGLCKCVRVSFPCVSNFIHKSIAKVVLHISLQGLLPPQLMGQLHERFRSLNTENCMQGIAQSKNEKTVFRPGINNKTRSNISLGPPAAREEAMHATGFVPAKVIRAMLLHTFLWDYLNSSPDWDDALSSGRHGYDLKNPNSTCKVLECEKAIKTMPLELFLQVMGSTRKFEDSAENCNLCLCLSDLPLHEYTSLMDTPATERLSSLLDFLCRLKLVRLVTDEYVEDRDNSPLVILTYALELKPYIEEPFSRLTLSSGVSSPDLCPKIRHDFILSSKEAVDVYWKTLEYCYVTADQKDVVHAFPGSAVQEVICVSNKKRQSRLDRFRNDQHLQKDFELASLKRKLSLKSGLPSKRLNPAVASEKQSVIMTDLQNHDNILHPCDCNGMAKTAENSVPFGVENQNAFLKLNQSRQQRFQWTKSLDRQLVMQYVRHRATLGAQCCIDWVSVPGRPAPVDTCKRRIHWLLKNKTFRTAIFRLCNLLGGHYARYMANSPHKERLSCNTFEQSFNESMNNEDLLASVPNEQRCDDFEDPDLKFALDEVFQCMQTTRLEHSQGVPKSISSITRDEVTQNHGGKFLKPHNESINVNKQFYESLAVTNAVELLKLVFLSKPSSPKFLNLMADTLQHYSMHDLSVAFNYLREKNIMVGGSGGKSFGLSLQFLNSLALSPFPTDTRNRASKFVIWLKEREKGLMEGMVHLDKDLQCGDIFHLLALVFAGVLSISPSLPEKGIGEAEENMDAKRKSDNDELCGPKNVKRLKSTNCGEVVSRQTKGFPNLKVFISQTTILKDDALELAQNENISGGPSVIETNRNGIPVEATVEGSPWTAMATYGNQLFSAFSDVDPRFHLSPELLKTTHSTILKAGDQGLNLKQISQIMALQGEKMVKLVLDVLQVFKVVIKVDAYNDVHFVDTSFRSKYFLTVVESHYQDFNPAPCMKPSKSDQNCLRLGQYSHRSSEPSISHDGMHKVTTFSMPDGAHQSLSEFQTCNKNLGCEHVMPVEGGSRNETLEDMISADSDSFRPIVPWLNGDGSINSIVYKALIRRVLGIVMQNPGIVKEGVIDSVDVLNPQTCRKLLELMLLDNHIVMKKMHQTICSGPPSLLRSISFNNLKRSSLICREHLFANPMRVTLL